MTSKPKIVIVGATGAVGREFLQLFHQRSIPHSRLTLLASERSAGNEMSTPYGNHTIQDLAKFSFSESNVVFFSAGGGRSKEFAPKALHEGAVVIDNSSAFRMDPDVPLVVPEINGETITPNHKLIANPNCSAIIMLMAVAPLRSLGKIRRIIVSTYQSASGAGAAAMEELKEQTGASLRGEPLEPKILPHPYAFNLFSHNTPIDANGYNEEENKVIEESRKILDMPDLLINPTCVRVPVLRAHSESITVEFADHAPSEADVRNVLSHSPGVKVMDDRATNTFPMPLAASGQNDVLVGRIRADISNPNAINLFVAGDQLLKGAALNAVQIAEMMIQKGLISGD